MGAPSLSTLSNYPIVFWHSDDFSQILLESCLDTVSSYLMGGGIMLISGWKAPGIMIQPFLNTFMPATSLIYDNNAVMVSAQSDSYPPLFPDPDKLSPTWNGLLPMIYAFHGAENPLYTAETTTGASSGGLPIAAIYDAHGTLVIFGFPLYYMQSAGVRALLQQLVPSLYPITALNEDSEIRFPFSFSIYPNPCRDRIGLSFNQKIPEEGRLELFNLKGQKAGEIHAASIKTSDYAIVWQFDDDVSSKPAGGIYFLRYDDGENRLIKKILILH